MDRNIAELESIIDSSFEWKTKQWAMLSEQAIQTHHSKSVYFDKTFYEYSKIIEKKLSITKEKNIDDNVNLKFSVFLLLSIIGFKFILNYLFSYYQNDSKLENSALFMIVFWITSSWVRDIIYSSKLSSVDNLIALFERDLHSCGLSWLFIQKLLLHDANNEQYEALSKEEKQKINLKTHFKDFCVSAAILSTFCNDQKLVAPPQEISRGGSFF